MRRGRRVHGIVSASAALLFVTAFAPVASAQAEPREEPLGVTVHDGDRVRAAVDRPLDVDRYVLRLAEGGWISLRLKTPRGSELVPRLVLRRPDGSVMQPGLALSEGPRGLRLRKLAVDTTGAWTILVDGMGGSTGDYRLSVAARRPRATGDE
ncbi:MAG: hypothetical protein ACYTDX_07080, partial [Planctomycetota bacterium]